MSEELKASDKIKRVGDMKLPLDAQLMLGDIYADVRALEEAALSRTPTEAIDPPSVEGLVKRIARMPALSCDFDCDSEVGEKTARDILALTAMPATGMVTEAMMEAGREAQLRSGVMTDYAAIFRAMIAAAGSELKEEGGV